jgi:hypothetical protein
MNKHEPRGIRNNNPLNIRYVPANKWKGRREPKQDKDFEEFTDIEYGYRAAFILFYNYIKRGCNTIAKIIGRWAPLTENNTNLYIQRVVQEMKWPANFPLEIKDPYRMIRLAAAMVKVECGLKVVDFWSIWEGYQLFCEEYKIKMNAEKQCVEDWVLDHDARVLT